MVLRPSPSPARYQNCNEAKHIKKTLGKLFVVFWSPPIAIPGVSQSSLPEENNIELISLVIISDYNDRTFLIIFDRKNGIKIITSCSIFQTTI